MTTDTMLRCALGVSDRTLSDFRSDGPSTKEMERLRAHVMQCQACQTRLGEFEALARTLRAQPELDDHAQLWQSVRASIAATSAQTAARRGHRTRSHSAQLWTAFGSIAAVVALAVGFVALFASHGGWPPFGTRVQGTRTIQSGSLTWRQVTLPVGFPDVSQSNDSATHTAATIAPSDGNTAYACQGSKEKLPTPRVWATHDAGASWSVITPTNLPANTGGCRIVVDANDANVLVVSFYPVLSPQQPALPNTWTTYASPDGGATWDKPVGLQDGNVTMTQASAHGRIYAIRGTAAPNGDLKTALYVSGDEMRSWTRIDATLPETAPNQSTIHDTGKTFAMWANSATGEVLVETYASSLWSTLDNGAHWMRIDYPENVYITDPHAPELIARPPTTSGGYLTICGLFTDNQIGANQWLACTADDGKTWSNHPATIILGFSIGGNGAIFGAGPINGDHDSAIYRLAPGGTTTGDWQRLGIIPGSNVGSGYQAAPTASGATVFWVFPGVATVTNGTHTLTFTQPNYYVATYP